MAAPAGGATKPGSKTRPSTMPAKTPLRRISRASLGALSASRNREEESSPLEHLNGPFAELAEAMEDLAVNFEALDAINEDLNSFNHGFGAFLYGLRMNAYASEFPQAPDMVNFEHAKTRATQEAEQKELQLQLAEEEASRQQGPSSPTPSTSAHNRNDMTFMTTSPGFDDGAPKTRGGPTARGGKQPAGTRAPGTKTVAQKKKEGLVKFAQPIIGSLPIQFREQQPQRTDAETVIGTLRQNSDGLRVAELVKIHPLIPQHRINDVLQALVRAKHGIKVTSKSGLVYRLDPLKYPPR